MSSIQLFDTHRAKTESYGVGVNIVNLTHALDAIMERTIARKGYTLFTVNLDHLVKLKSNRRFREVYQRADFISADGWPIVWLLHRQAARVQRTTGADLVQPLCEKAAELGLPVYFIGPSRSSQEAALDVLRSRYPGLIVVGAEAPEVPADINEDAAASLAERVARSGARLCLVSLGAPKQELLADALHRKCPGVGIPVRRRSARFYLGPYDSRATVDAALRVGMVLAARQ